MTVSSGCESLSDGALRFTLADEISHYLNGDCGPDPAFCVNEDTFPKELEAKLDEGADVPGRSEIEAKLQLSRWAERAADTGALYLTGALGVEPDYSVVLNLRHHSSPITAAHIVSGGS